MKRRPGLQAYDKEGDVLPGAQILAKDGKIQVLMAGADVTDRATIVYCHRVVDTDPDSSTFGKIGWRCMGIRNVEGVTLASSA